VLPPPPLGHPPYYDNPQKVDENLLLKNKGVKGMLPLGCLPLWGSEGVILVPAAENNRVMGK
jgi:hypothetical protein